MAKKDDFKCPVCGSQVTFTVTATGKLTRPVIQNSYQTDGRCGVDCSECDWRLHGSDMEEGSPFSALADSALEAQDSIQFLSAKRKTAA